MNSSNTSQYDLKNLNWDHLRRNQIFKYGRILISDEYSQSDPNSKKTLRSFKDLPSISPIQPVSETSHLNIPDEKNKSKHYERAIDDIRGLIKKDS